VCQTGASGYPFAVASSERYRLLRLLKRGGMAEVFEALMLGEGGFQRRVALKRILPERAEEPEVLKAFEDEARIASQLHHANIVNVLDFGVMDAQPSWSSS
jgi:serine/threonine-protein kinase